MIHSKKRQRALLIMERQQLRAEIDRTRSCIDSARNHS